MKLLTDNIEYLIFLIVIIIIRYFYSKTRTKKLTEHSEKEGFSFKKHTKLSSQIIDQKFHAITSGSPLASNQFEKKMDDVTITVFDIDNTQHKDLRFQTIVLLSSSNFAFPSFSIVPKETFQKIKTLSKINNIALPENIVFSEQYHLAGDDEDSIHELFSDSKLDELMKADIQCIEASGKYFLYYGYGKKIADTEFNANLDKAFNSLNLVLDEKMQ